MHSEWQVFMHNFNLNFSYGLSGFLDSNHIFHKIISFKFPNYSILLNTISPAEGQLYLNKSTGFASLSKYEGETTLNSTLAIGWKWRILNAHWECLSQAPLEANFHNLWSLKQSQTNFGKVSGNRIGVGLSQRMLSLCSRSCLVTAQFVLPRVGGEGSRCNSSLLVPASRGAGNLRLSQLTPGRAISSWERVVWTTAVRNLGDGAEHLGKESKENCVPCVLFSRGLPKCFPQSSSVCWRNASPWSQLQEVPSSHDSAEGSQALPLGNPFPTIIDLSSLFFFNFSFFLTSCLVLTVCFSLHLNVLFTHLFLPFKMWPKSSDGSRGYKGSGPLVCQ